MRKTILTTVIGTALMGSVAMNAHAQDEPQGMYSADDILDAEVYFAGGSGEEIGDVDDILFDEEMRITAIVEEVEAFPAYNNEWWEQTKANARDAWQTTQEGAESAWQRTREALDIDDNG